MKRKPPAREDIKARRNRLLAVLRAVVPTIPNSVVLDGQECKIIDPKALAEEYGFHPLQILNDLADLTGLEEIEFGHAMIPTGKRGRCEQAWVVSLR